MKELFFNFGLSMTLQTWQTFGGVLCVRQLSLCGCPIPLPLLSLSDSVVCMYRRPISLALLCLSHSVACLYRSPISLTLLCLSHSVACLYKSPIPLPLLCLSHSVACLYRSPISLHWKEFLALDEVGCAECQRCWDCTWRYATDSLLAAVVGNSSGGQQQWCTGQRVH